MLFIVQFPSRRYIIIIIIRQLVSRHNVNNNRCLIYSIIFFLLPDIQLVELFEVEEGTKESPVDGVTWLENKIYVVCRGSNRVHVFPDQEPFDELKEEEIKIEGMKRPWDMSASKVSRSMFISDPGDRCLWRVQMPGGGISRWEMDGTPGICRSLHRMS